MSRTYRLAPEAETELDEIWLYVAKRTGSLYPFAVACRVREIGTHASGQGRREFPPYTRSQTGLDIADRLIDTITERFYSLASNPHIGRRRDEDLRPGMRSFPIGEYVILYRIGGEDVLILHVTRGSRDIPRLL